MSGESLIHVRLVERLIMYVRERHCPPRGLLLLADHHSFSTNRPLRIGGFLPDLFASDLPVTFEVLGEAKTPSDLETQRSARQITAFLDHLAVREQRDFHRDTMADVWVCGSLMSKRAVTMRAKR